MRAGLALLVVVTASASCGGSGAPEGSRTRSPNDAQALTAASDDEPEGAPVARPPTPQEQRVVDQLTRIAEQVRGLELISPVRAEVRDRRAIVAFLTSELEDEDLAESRELYVALGLLPPELDVRAMLESVLGEQVVGYYDHEGDVLVLRDDIARRLGRPDAEEAHITIVHELVHALQDQRLGLGERFEDDDTDTDPGSAYHALVEGDATLAMLGYAAARAGVGLDQLTGDPERLQGIIDSAPPMARDDELTNAPPIVRVTLVSSYIDGLMFAADLHRRGGWAEVDRAHVSPPVSTEQVLHPDAFARGALPDPIALPQFPELESAGLVQVEEDTLGELEMGVYLGQLEPEGVNEHAAAGWSGDRLRFYRSPSGPGAVVWFTTWDNGVEAQEAEAAARAIATALPAAERSRQLVQRQGRVVIILRNLAPELHRPVIATLGQVRLPPTPPRAPATSPSPP